MKRRNLLVLTFLALFSTGGVLNQTGSLSHHAATTGTRILGKDPLSTEARLRWQTAQPQHWRSCLLQH